MYTFKLTDEVIQELYGFLFVNENKLTDGVYSLKVQLEKIVYSQLSMKDIEKLKDDMRQRYYEKQ